MKYNVIPISLFEIEWQGAEWAVNQTISGSNVIVENFIEPSQQQLIIPLLNALQETYYKHHGKYFSEDRIKREVSRIRILSGNELVNGIYNLMDNTLPWKLHIALNDIQTEIGLDQYRLFLELILKRNWILSWHWRAALPILQKWNEMTKGQKLIIQISHFRKWEILLCYSVREELLLKYGRITFVPLKEKNLLRAPIFSLSHRLSGWDVYRLFYQKDKENQKYVLNEEITQIKDELKNRYLANPIPVAELANIFGRHDCYYVIENVKYEDNKFKWEIKSYIELEPEKTFIDEAVLGKAEYFQPDDLICIPSFGKKNDGIPQLLSSDNYCEAVIDMTKVLNDPTVKSVLLIAPPGSGKEELSKLAYYCRDNKTFTDNFVATTFAGLTSIEASRLLFSFDHDDSDLTKYKLNDKDGLIFKALGGAIFIDEIDKTHESILNMLLRVLESGEFSVPESSMVIKIPKDKTPLYIFSGSKSRNEMFKLKPSDFWTRISHVIEVEHPLNISDSSIKKLVLKDYLWMFWCMHVNEFIKMKGVTKECNDVLAKPFNNFNKELYKFLLNKVIVNFTSEVLAKELLKRGKRKLYSIRTLRSIVGSAVFNFIEVLMYAKSKEEPIEQFKKACNDAIYITTWANDIVFRNWFNELVKLFKNENMTNPINEKTKEHFIQALSDAVSLVDNN